ncbi:hypothetical protein EDB19DRAFT_465020 [Suillus lakei]|nr:hypothetical protein EDB19DRAFT_465020 [Suillus lakei]
MTFNIRVPHRHDTPSLRHFGRTPPLIVILRRGALIIRNSLRHTSFLTCQSLPKERFTPELYPGRLTRSDAPHHPLSRVTLSFPCPTHSVSGTSLERFTPHPRTHGLRQTRLSSCICTNDACVRKYIGPLASIIPIVVLLRIFLWTLALVRLLLPSPVISPDYARSLLVFWPSLVLVHIFEPSGGVGTRLTTDELGKRSHPKIVLTCTKRITFPSTD